jgi:16S rRNA (guanine527-N7)-methyltransferase
VAFCSHQVRTLSCYDGLMSGMEVEAFREALERQAATWSVACGPTELDALVRHATLLMTWNARINLTGATSLEDLVAQHLPDSFALASRLPPDGPASAIDVGSGGGLPALPLAVLRPLLKLRLIEPIAKKAAFLRTAVRELSLRERVTVVNARAEKAGSSTFDVAISRATLPPAEWMALGGHLVAPGGHVFVLASEGSEPGPPPPPLTLAARIPYLDGRRILLDLVRPA